MPEFTTAYLDNGQRIKASDADLRQWRDEVDSGVTTQGLAQWFAFDPDTGDVLDDVELLGMARDEHECDHHDEQTIRVTNAAQTGEYNRDAAHASVWVCSSRLCLLGAAAWVERDTDDEARFTADSGRTWHGLSLPFV